MQKLSFRLILMIMLSMSVLVLTSCGWIPAEDNLPEYVLEIEKAEIETLWNGDRYLHIIYKDYYGLDTWGSVFKDSSGRKALRRDEFIITNGIVYRNGAGICLLDQKLSAESGELTPGMTATIYSDWAYLLESESGGSVFGPASKIIAKIRFTPTTVVISEEE